MENLYIEGAKGEFYTPLVSLTVSTGICEVSGESYLEYTGEFYAQITQWIRNYAQEVKKGIIFNFRLSYFNTSSFKALLGVLKVLKEYRNQGGEVDINWFYPPDDEDILREAQDLAEGAAVEMNYIEQNF
ncbi:MAG: DUF1987 domain-containing protein [Cytophagia bacterium]|nr:MAG: DUF1987 domain-containing protein [Cytophagales bacterium]TAF99476.1 MAG: DUF1987 domain-containing protein [Cytophagia bacterium]TAG42349.1 MAG: DUF1987 domain-containing protein [Cytophagia bacterium]